MYYSGPETATQEKLIATAKEFCEQWKRTFKERDGIEYKSRDRATWFRNTSKAIE